MLGVMPIDKAMDLANERKLDLVNISPNAKPAVCKILDYGKYRYELQKKEKAKTAAKFLADGDKVKVGLRFRGRERDYAAKGMDVMNTFAEAVSDVGVVEKKPVFEGRNLTMFLGPKSDK